MYILLSTLTRVIGSQLHWHSNGPEFARTKEVTRWVKKFMLEVEESYGCYERRFAQSFAVPVCTAALESNALHFITSFPLAMSYEKPNT